MLWVPAHMKAQTTASGKKKPAVLPALMPAIFTFGATPTMPMPFLAAAMVPAVWGPWPLSSIQADGLVFGTPVTHETLLPESTLAARSGWVKSLPVSMAPTVTDGPAPLVFLA